MAEVRRRSTASAGTKTASRRRDRAAVNEEEDEDEEDVDATPPRRRTAAKTTTRRRRPAPVEDEEDEDEEEEPPPVRKKRRPAPEPEDEEDEEEDEDEEDEEPPPPRRKRKPAPAVDEEEDEEEEEPAPRKRAPAKKAAARKKAAPKLPPGIRAGMAGVEATAKDGGGGEGRITLDKTPILVKILEPEPLVSFRQHWLSQGKGQGDRAYTCMGKAVCPVCKLGDRASLAVIINVLNLSAEGEPKNEYLQIGKRAYDSLIEQATDAKGTIRLEKDLWSVNKTGKGTSSQTNVRPVKVRDIQDDWEEVLENFESEDEADIIAELDEIIAEAKENLFEISGVVQTSTLKQLRDVSKYLADDEDDEDDEDD
jgi:hypothetical protein